MSLNFPRNNRLFEELENSNRRIYRESETHVKILHDRANIRKDLGFGDVLYEEPHDPEKYLESLNKKFI